MNRVSLSAFAAALLLSNPAAILAQEKTITTSTGMELVWISPGEFMLGSTPEEREWARANGCSQEYVDREGQSRAMIQQGFWLGRTEVTVGQWKLFVTETGYLTHAEKNGWSIAPTERVSGASWRDPKFGVQLTDNHPVCCVSWNDAKAFCEWLTEAAKKANKLPVGMVCRLPSEAEWEYACRAGTQTKFWWGDTVSDGLKRAKWKEPGDTLLVPETVDNFGPNGRNRFGLADMLGNVREWCLDGFDAQGAHAQLYQENPTRRILRGGSFNHPPGVTRCAVREQIGTDFSYSSLGFRVCIGVPGGSGQPSQNTGPIVAAIPPPPALTPTMARTTAPMAPVLTPPAPVVQRPMPGRPQMAIVQPTPPAMRVMGVKQTTFEISNISSSFVDAYINNAWIMNALCMQAALRVNEDIGKEPPMMKAYFYNRNRELVGELKQPTSVSFSNRESFKFPEKFVPGKKYSIYFGVSQSIQRGKEKWKNVIVVFGNREKATADIHPKEDLAQFDFPEKELVMKGRGGR